MSTNSSFFRRDSRRSTGDNQTPQDTPSTSTGRRRKQEIHDLSEASPLQQVPPGFGTGRRGSEFLRRFGRIPFRSNSAPLPEATPASTEPEVSEVLRPQRTPSGSLLAPGSQLWRRITDGLGIRRPSASLVEEPEQLRQVQDQQQPDHQQPQQMQDQQQPDHQQLRQVQDQSQPEHQQQRQMQDQSQPEHQQPLLELQSQDLSEGVGRNGESSKGMKNDIQMEEKNINELSERYESAISSIENSFEERGVDKPKYINKSIELANRCYNEFRSSLGVSEENLAKSLKFLKVLLKC